VKGISTKLGTQVKILHVVGARPNFMKIAPVMRAVAAKGFAEQRLVHTGQHYDEKMSEVFFRDLALPAPDVHLGVGSGTHAEQTARVMTALEPVLASERPDLVVVAGDVNSTLAAAVVAAKAVIPVAHVEAGLRSFDRTMPEETNRIVTDRLSDLLLTPSADADENLRREGAPEESIARVGNVMIDSLQAALQAAQRSDALSRHGLQRGAFALITMHRPSNVDEPAMLERLLGALAELARDLPVLFPVHPRTRERIAAAGLRADGVLLCDPEGYVDFLALMAAARLVLTDSGGIQEETTVLGVPCLTLRENTERPITVEQGTNVLVGRGPARIGAEARKILRGEGKRGRIPDLWDGQAAARAAEAIRAWAARRGVV
jgi:UDP-N-acetylglucosamine 2-epimerase (non-hydrolysing)